MPKPDLVAEVRELGDLEQFRKNVSVLLEDRRMNWLVANALRNAIRLANEVERLRNRAKNLEDLIYACPGCIKCGPPFFAKASEACDGSGSHRPRAALHSEDKE